MDRPDPSAPSPWRWVPTLYFAQGLPYVAVMSVAVVMYKGLGISNTDIALYTSWLYLPWVIKPFWAPFVDLLGAKRAWITGLQGLLAVALALVALTLPTDGFFRYTLAVFWLLAFSSATHDIAADGFYLLALPAARQAAFVGVRSTCYRLAMVGGQGGLVYVAGWWQERTGNVRAAWVLVFALLAVFFVAVALYHVLALPRPAADRPARDAGPADDWWRVFAGFFRKPGIGVALAFLLLYRLGEAQLVKLLPPFLLDARSVGGLGLSTKQVSLAYGTIGVAALLAGGLLGGYLIARHGLRRMLWPMLAVMHGPNLVYVLLAAGQPASVALIAGAVALEQFGYGFGFTAYLVYLMRVAEGPHRTAHYAIGTGFMALGMMLPGMVAGWIQDHIGYPAFFTWVCVATLPSFVVAARLRLEPAEKTSG